MRGFLGQLTRLPQLADRPRGPGVSIGRSGHEAATLEVLAGYQRGLWKLHPGDHEERAWFLDRIRDRWTIVGPSAAEPVRAPVPPD